MPIKVQCPGCGKSLHGKDELAGKRVKCPKCDHLLTMPKAESASDSPDLILRKSGGDPVSDSGNEHLLTKSRRWVIYAGIAALIGIGAIGVWIISNVERASKSSFVGTWADSESLFELNLKSDGKGLFYIWEATPN